MNESDFEGTIVLEKLNEIGEVEAFFDAIDGDDFARAKALMKKAGIDTQTMAIVLKKMAESED